MQPGVTTDEIDKAVHKMIIDNGAYPSPLTYGEHFCYLPCFWPTCLSAVLAKRLSIVGRQDWLLHGGHMCPSRRLRTLTKLDAAGGFPKSVCTSVNECICHGIPDSRQLQDGDIVNIDVTVYLNVSLPAPLQHSINANCYAHSYRASADLHHASSQDTLGYCACCMPLVLQGDVQRHSAILSACCI